VIEIRTNHVNIFSSPGPQYFNLINSMGRLMIQLISILMPISVIFVDNEPSAGVLHHHVSNGD
jgi:hypothetical protein